MTTEEPEAYKDETLRSIGISPRERLANIEAMLVKIDEKMDRRFTDLEKRVWSLEVNVGPAATRLAIDLKEHDEKLDVMEGQLSSVRKWMWTAVGAISALTFFVGFGVQHQWF